MNIFSNIFPAPRLSRLVPLAALAGLALLPAAAHAQVAGLSFSFLPATQTVAIGGSADYNGVFTNATSTNYFVTGGTYFPSSFGGSPLVTAFFNGDPNNNFGPVEVFAGKTVTIGGVETLVADPSLGVGSYSGVVDFQGQTEADFKSGTGSDITLSSAPLTLMIANDTPAPVPEASTLVSLGLLLLLGGAGVWRARRGSRSTA